MDYPSRNRLLTSSCSKIQRTSSKDLRGKKPSVEYEIYIEEESLDTNEPEKPTCQVCQKTFVDYPSRNRHLISAHPVGEENPPAMFVIDVEQESREESKTTNRKTLESQVTRTPIQKKFNSYRSRCRLLRSARKGENPTGQIKPAEKPQGLDGFIPCLESNCGVKFPFIQDLRNHLVIDHGFEPPNEAKFQFFTLQEFEDWKKELEERTENKWFKHHTKTFKFHRIFVYDCLKIMKYRKEGRSDSDMQCTSQIIVKAFKGRKGRKTRLEVSFFEGHYGHGQPNRRNLPRSESFEDVYPERGERMKCHLCHKTLCNRITLKRHINTIHMKEKVPDNSLGPIECLEPNCGKKFRVRRFLRQHLISDHHFEMHTGDTLHFSTLEEFENWKIKLEEETQSFYKKRQRDTNKTYKVTIQYVCCRAGKMFSTDNRKRNLKRQGSRRSNIHCTSEIKLRYLDEGFEVLYFKDHYGHDNSLVHLPVPKKVKEEIAEKLMAGLPVRSILQELRLSSGDQLNRKHLIRKKDVDNIKAAYGIITPRYERRSVNQISDIDTWVKDMKTNFDGVILFYKPEDECHEELEKSEFVVVCMTPFQRKMATKFGGDRICVDSTYNEVIVHEQVCELTTILVVNDYEEAIPIAFCLSSRVNMHVLRLFFCSVRDVIGHIECHTFVAIEDPQFHDTWCQIMQTPPCHVMCAWHIDTAWKSRLGRITNKNKRLWIYERLKACQLQCDINEFQEMFESLLYELDLSEDTKEFCEYMNKYYTNRPELWANAHRIGIKINTNLYLDNFHRIVRRNFLSGRGKHNIEKCISAISDYILDREYDQLVEYCRGKVSTKMEDIASCHEAGLTWVSAVSTIIESSCWAVSASSQDLIYVVNKVENHNCDSACAIFCERCMACLKAYTCSCDDNAIRGNVCQHLHAVAEYQKSPEDAVQYIVIEGTDGLLTDQNGVMIDEGEVMIDHEVKIERSEVAVDRGERNQGFDENRIKVIKDEDDRINDCDDQIMEYSNDDQIIGVDDQIIGDDDQIIGGDDHIIGDDDQIIGDDDQIIDDDDDIIGDDDHIIVVDDQIIGDDEHIIVVDDQINDDEYSEDDGSGEPDSRSTDSKSKSDLVTTALQLMGDLAGFENVPESVSVEVKKHIEMARKLLQKSLAASISRND